MGGNPGWVGGPGGEGKVERKRSGGVSVSTALTSAPHRRFALGRNRSIPTNPAGRVDVGPVNINAVDTKPRDWSTLRDRKSVV